MTRINTIDPAYLTDKHLIAEYRELPRVFALITKWVRSGCKSPRPSQYTLGKGHVRFFYDKPSWLRARHRALVNEMRARSFEVNHPETPPCAEGPDVGWEPDEFDRLRSYNRLCQREAVQDHRWCGEPVQRWYRSWRREIVFGPRGARKAAGGTP